MTALSNLSLAVALASSCVLTSCAKAGGNDTRIALSTSTPTGGGASSSASTLSPIAHLQAKTSSHLEHRTLRFSVGPATSVIDDFIVRRDTASIRVIDLLFIESQATVRSYSVSEAAATETQAVLLVGAGSAGVVGGAPAALGLIISDGHVISPISSSEFASGVLCIESDGLPSIKRKSSVVNGLCSGAIQSGPLIIEPGHHLGEGRGELKRAAHHYQIAAVEGDGSLHLITTSKTHLYDVARYLMENKEINAAINLGTDGGFIVRDGATARSYGSVQSLVPAVVAVFPR